jgi:hypothetical protein
MSARNFAKRKIESVPLSLTFEGEQGLATLHFRVAFNFKAFSLIEEKTGINMLTGELFRKLNAGNLVVALWAGLAYYHEDFRGDEALDFLGEIVDLSNSGEVAKAVKQAFLFSLGKEQREKIENAEKANGAAEGGADPLVTTPTA